MKASTPSVTLRQSVILSGSQAVASEGRQTAIGCHWRLSRKLARFSAQTLVDAQHLPDLQRITSSVVQLIVDSLRKPDVSDQILIHQRLYITYVYFYCKSIFKSKYSVWLLTKKAHPRTS